MPELDPLSYSLSDSSQTFDVRTLLNTKASEASLEDVIADLQKLYCGSMAVEFMHMNVSWLEWSDL